MRAKNRRAVIVFDLDEHVDNDTFVAQLAARLMGMPIGGLAEPEDLRMSKLRKITFDGEVYLIGG